MQFFSQFSTTMCLIDLLANALSCVQLQLPKFDIVVNEAIVIRQIHLSRIPNRFEL